MHFGVQIRATAETMPLGELGRRVEAAGFESLFVPEHTHIPVSVGQDHPEGATGWTPANASWTPSWRWRPSPRPPRPWGSVPASASSLSTTR